MRVKKFCFFVLVLAVILLLAGSIYAQTLKINEVVSANFNSAIDEDGDPSDWIEIYNPDTSPVNLLNYSLSDRADNLQKWTFPDIIIEPDSFQLVFASGKDRTLVAYWETIIDWGDDWKYFVGTQPPPNNWQAINFNDANWPSGPSGFGDGDGDDATIIPEIGNYLASSVFIRHSFTMTDVNDVVAALMNIDYNDAFVAWLNGIEIARENIGYYGNYPAFNELNDISSHDPQIYQGREPNHYLIENIQSILQTGDNVLAIQTNTKDSDLSMIPFFTLGYASEPISVPYISPYAEPNLPNLHTNFKLGEIETVYLSNTTGNEIDQLSISNLLMDISIGRQPDGGASLFYFNETTPGASNITTGFGGMLEEPIIEPEAGFYDGSATISISAAGSGETIYISFDGSVPSDTSSTSYIYNPAFQINTTRVLRARSFKQGFVPSRTVTKTFLLNTNHYLPVISLITDPYNFFDYNYGIYVTGPNTGTGANFWQDWERPIHLEMFETDHSLVLNTDCGIKIFGFASRGFAQKSLALFARSQYGNSSFEHQIFKDKPYSSFQGIVLRNSGGDWLWTNIRDGFMVSNLKDTNLAYQAFRPAVCYLNGEYWGIYNIREKLNEHFYTSNFGVDPDNIDYLENHRRPIIGNTTYFDQMMDYIDTHDLSIQEYYDHVCTLMDIENFISYQVAELWYNNTDWPGANYRYWRERTPDAKWRWQIFDLDFGMGLNYDKHLNMLDYELSGEDWGSPYRNEPWATYLFRRLVENDEFIEKLVTRFADYMNTIFQEEYMTAKIDSTFNYLYQEMENHMIRWGGDIDGWYNNERLIMLDFTTAPHSRNYYMRQFIVEQFNLNGTFNISADVYPAESGTIQISSVVPDSLPWEGVYFQDYPVIVKTIPADGYRFIGWTGDVVSASSTISLQDTVDIAVIANFEETNYEPELLPVINEINYNSSDLFAAGDWVEIYNPASEKFDLSGWHFKDSDDAHDFIFPQNYILGAKQYIVICRDLEAFTTNLPDVTNFLGQFDFGLSSTGEYIRLIDSTMVLIDSVYYGVEDPWPTEPNGSGPTLSLKNAKMDNTSAVSWSASSGNGTPGEQNDNWEPYPAPFSDKLKIMPNYPNPFSISTKIIYSLPQDGKVELSIYNLKGQLVKKLVDEIQETGSYTETWDGRNQQDKPVGSGVYFYQIRYHGSSKTKKMILVR
ncbi:MAG: CotH kinase family protein [Candidatus Cloacimonadales bacterium]|nr:CotH kinase family protein [Candidatus Cloacimonadales bacterium]